MKGKNKTSKKGKVGIGEWYMYQVYEKEKS